MKRLSRPADRPPCDENVRPDGTDTLNASTNDVIASVWVSSALPNTFVATSACNRPVPRFASAAVDEEMSTFRTVRPSPPTTTRLTDT